MKREIERKFLVKSDAFKLEENILNKLDIKQGYLSKKERRIVRVRTTYYNFNNHTLSNLTIKTKVKGDSEAGVNEFEYQIPNEDAELLLNASKQPILEKTRYLIDCNGTNWEVDVFHGQQTGLILAEVELENADQEFFKPEWLGEEVTGLRS